jgi:hypothetical protein
MSSYLQAHKESLALLKEEQETLARQLDRQMHSLGVGLGYTIEESAFSKKP